MNTMNIKNKTKTLGVMLTGAGILVIGAIVVWSIMNFDILVKAYRYPEAIRALQITVQVVKPVTAAK